MPSEAVSSKRDPRIDVLRGMALLMIFVDHIPGNVLSLVTLHNFGFSDAAEVFVLLAGMSSMMAYGKAFERDGALGGLHRIILRCARLYLFQIGLLLTTLVVVLLWTVRCTHSQRASRRPPTRPHLAGGTELSRHSTALSRAVGRLSARVCRPAA